MSEQQIVIIGGGPTGIGAAWRLNELGHSNWTLIEREDRAGGLSASFVDEKGFTWDIGGHVLFSHYEYFDRLMDRALGDQWVSHERESWIWTQGRFIPYPFQYNIRHLPSEAQWDCVLGLVKLRRQGPPFSHPVGTFKDWILANFGEGLARHFLLPYNQKVWAWPLEEMDFRWTGDRVAVVDLDRILDNIILKQDDVAWGPNNKFRFPLRGGTGAIWRSLAAQLPRDRIIYHRHAVRIDPDKHVIYFPDGGDVHYDILISTMPLDNLVKACTLSDLVPEAEKLEHNAVELFGFGLLGQPPQHLATKCWMYFPESDLPFFRVTVFSNYSPNNVPDASNYWSLMAEVSHSPHQPLIQPEKLKDEVIAGLLSAKLLPDASQIISVVQRSVPYAYPIPTLKREGALAAILPELEKLNIYSRGRFGAWKYEVGNQDHSAMQGVEIVDRILSGAQETTGNDPDKINTKR